MAMDRSLPTTPRPKCTANLAGSFTTAGPIPGHNATRYAFQPADPSCQLEQITRGQLLHYLNSIGAPLTIVGDSMMRQFFLRIVMMLRGQQRLLDYHLRTHATYQVCHEADSFRLEMANPTGDILKEDYRHLISTMPEFFLLHKGPGAAAARQALSACSHSPHEVHFLSAPHWYSQKPMLTAYVEMQPSWVKPVLVVSIGYWERTALVPQNYLDSLIAASKRARKVIVVGVPTIKVSKEKKTPESPSQAENLATRNRFMREWVQQQGEKFLYLDFEGLAAAENRPPLPGECQFEMNAHRLGCTGIIAW